MLRKAFRQLRSNLGAIILALLLSFVIWIVASLQTDPFDTRSYVVAPVTVVQQPDGTVLTGQTSQQVSVTVRARKSVLTQLAASDFHAILDLSGIALGTQTAVPIVVTCGSDQVRIESVDPAAQSVTLVTLETVTRAIEIRVLGKPEAGYKASRPIVIPDRLSLQGPAISLSQVLSVTGFVSIAGAHSDITESVVVEVLDSAGKPVSGLEWEPAQVEVRVPVRPSGKRVVPMVRGEPAAGYRKGDVAAVPSIVTLSGPATVLDTLPDFVETQPITITGATRTLLRQRFLVLPPGVDVEGRGYVTVTVPILPVMGTRIMTGNVEMAGVPLEMEANPIPSIVTVTLEGPEVVLENLNPDELFIVLDLRGYSRGIQRIQPLIFPPEGAAIVSFEPETVVVIIQPIPTPTPVPTPTPTITPTSTPRPKP